jgi:predicted esterase
LSERRKFTASLLALFGSAGCSRPSTKRVATLRHEPWVLWPQGDAPAGGWPAILFLHGQGEAAWTLDGNREREQGPEAVLAHGSPASLHRARDPRVKTLWENFVLVAPQAVNDQGLVRYWRWGDAGIKHRVATELQQVLATGKVNAARLCVAGFSRGGLGCFELDASAEPLQFRKIVAADAQSLDGLSAAAQRKRDVRVYYARSTYADILAPHLAAEQVYGQRTPPISIIATELGSKEGEAHIEMCSRIFGDDEVYRWLLT